MKISVKKRPVSTNTVLLCTLYSKSLLHKYCTCTSSLVGFSPIFLRRVWSRQVRRSPWSKFHSESIEWFLEDQAFSTSYRMLWLIPLLPFASGLLFLIFLCVAGRAYWWERGEGRARGRSQNRRDRRIFWSSIIRGTLNTLWFQWFWQISESSPRYKIFE